MRLICKKSILIVFCLIAIAISGCRESEHRFILSGSFLGQNEIVINFAGIVDGNWGKEISSYLVYTKNDPDIPLSIKEVELQEDGKTALLKFDCSLNQKDCYVVRLSPVPLGGNPLGEEVFMIKKSYFALLLSILIGAMLVQNFVFSKYLGLCIFFGTSQRKATAIGMGISFTIVMVCSIVICWALYRFVLKPFNLEFLQVLVFIGIVSMFTQLVDTILRKVNPYMFSKLGVYLVLIVTNCVILAVPLIMADNDYDLMESLMLAIGAGAGFMLALFLMASVRERLEIANIPRSFRGLPIAFIVAGLFALAFTGFSGLSLF
ncbi:MAG: Rnf-Nqr domain containing protein [Pseudomonadota bacterium]